MSVLGWNAAVRRGLLLVALALVVVSCGGGDTVVATVDGHEITLAEVEALRPDGEGADDPLFHQDLQNLILDRILLDGLEELGVEATEAEIEQGIEEFRSLVESQSDPDTGAPVEWESFLVERSTTEEIVALTIGQQVRSEKAVAVFGEEAEVTEEQIDAALGEGLLAEQARRAEACVRHILLDNEEAAGVVLELTRSEGANFGALASVYSIGPTAPNGGDLGCAPASDYVDEFAIAIVEAEVGVPYGPVATEFGWHVLLVEERTAPTLEELRADLVADIRDIIEADLRDELGRAAFEEWAADLPGQATVEIEDRFGTWAQAPGGSWIVIPADAG